jgi:uncharacterized protein YjbI with pentapeptide repeats
MRLPFGSAGGLAALLVLLGAAPCPAKPTPEQVSALAQTCKAEKRQLDLIAAFGTDFTGLDLTGLDLRGAHAVGLEPIMTAADFTGATLRNVQFGSARLDTAVFADADLSGASFVTASLRGADLRGAKLAGTRIYQSHLDRAKLPRADLSRADITGSSFAGADLSHATLAGATNDYWWTDFTGANLNAADLSGLKLAGAKFVRADLRGAKLSAANLEQADFTGADLNGADLNGAVIEAADFRRANGLTDEERERLAGAARRGQFELTEGVAALVPVAYWGGYLLVVAAQIGLTVRVYRRHGRTGLWLLCGAVNAAALIPSAFLGLMLLSGSSPVAQLNAGPPGGLGLWSVLVTLWPVCLAGVPVALLLVGVGVVVFLARPAARGPLRREWARLGYAALTVVHLLLAARLLFLSAPTA